MTVIGNKSGGIEMVRELAHGNSLNSRKRKRLEM